MSSFLNNKTDLGFFRFPLLNCYGYCFIFMLLSYCLLNSLFFFFFSLRHTYILNPESKIFHWFHEYCIEGCELSQISRYQITKVLGNLTLSVYACVVPRGHVNTTFGRSHRRKVDFSYCFLHFDWQIFSKRDKYYLQDKGVICSFFLCVCVFYDRPAMSCYKASQKLTVNSLTRVYTFSKISLIHVRWSQS